MTSPSMNVFLDDKPLTAQPTFAAALRTAVDEAARSGRVVVEATLDGDAIADGVLENPPEEALGTELRLVSVEPKVLVRATLLDAADALETVVRDQRKSAEFIHQGKVEEAMPPLSAAIQTWQVVRETVEKGAALVQVPLDSVKFRGGASGADRLLDLIATLTTGLEEVKRSLAAEDWSGLADVLAYDMCEQAEKWGGTLRSLSASLEPEGEPGV